MFRTDGALVFSTGARMAMVTMLEALAKPILSTRSPKKVCLDQIFFRSDKHTERYAGERHERGLCTIVVTDGGRRPSWL